MRPKVVATAAIMIVALIFSAGHLISTGNKTVYPDDEKVRLVMRNIGHELLLSDGDRDSRVLPVKKLSNSLWQIIFESQNLSINHDSLLRIVNRNFLHNGLPLDYSLNVRDTKSEAVVYEYKLGDQGTKLVPCTGRVEPGGAYSVQIMFRPVFSASASGGKYLIAISLGFVAMFVAGHYLKERRQKVAGDPLIENAETVGKYKFDVTRGTLVFKDETIQLSDKEANVLIILSRNRNQLVEREALLKEVWEDQGVITGRSLDVFISRLRKKLQGDERLKIVNVHGRGYRLEGGG